MNKTNNPLLRKNAQELRSGMTPEEKHLWYDFLKKLPVTVNRQKVIGWYIVDFYVAEAKLVIELDGIQHYDETARIKDAYRDKYLASQGIYVLRYLNYDVFSKFTGVCHDIYNHINARLDKPMDFEFEQLPEPKKKRNNLPSP